MGTGFLRLDPGLRLAFEIVVTQLQGKFKLSQNRSAADRAGVVAGLGAHPMAPQIRP